MYKRGGGWVGFQSPHCSAQWQVLFIVGIWAGGESNEAGNDFGDFGTNWGIFPRRAGEGNGTSHQGFMEIIRPPDKCRGASFSVITMQTSAVQFSSPEGITQWK
ncbi:hypothetical protein niasHS_011699 [Heterodera schachtii]|uniref:Uncharacterized protein n=1 Tax=Heterodera schachtii TaxID=97005 RepID=A0ABD2IUG0_HETSC